MTPENNTLCQNIPAELIDDIHRWAAKLLRSKKSQADAQGVEAMMNTQTQTAIHVIVVQFCREHDPHFRPAPDEWFLKKPC